jgi:hypothetical protein
MFAATQMSYTEQEITRLIKCPKTVLDAPRREMKAVDGFRRNDLSLIAVGVPGYFYVFTRQTEDFPENFSIGLRYDPKNGNGDIILLRCNGPHGPYNNGADPNHPHWDFHVHRASQEAIESGFRAEKHAEKALEFASFEEALPYFLKEINVEEQDVETYFPGSGKQLDLGFSLDIQ